MSGAILAAVIGYALTVRIAGFGMDCMIKTLTGPECPGCGLSRAAASILRLDPAAAFSYNAIRPLYMAGGLWAGIFLSSDNVKKERIPLLPRPTWLSITALSTILFYGIIRNII